MLSILSVLSCIIDIGDTRPPGSITEADRLVLFSPEIRIGCGHIIGTAKTAGTVMFPYILSDDSN